MKYVLAILACIVIFIAYVIIGAALGWRHGGGLIPVMILFAAIGATWRAITKKRPDKDSEITTSSEAIKDTNTSGPIISHTISEESNVEQESIVSVSHESQTSQQEKKNCRLAIISFILGILGLLLFCIAILPGLPAVICGHLALSKIKRARDTLHGRGMAIAGLSMGYIAIAFTVLTILVGFVEGFKESFKDGYNESIQTDNLSIEDRWPSAFDLKQQATVFADFEQPKPKLTEELVDNMAKALGFWFGQEYSLEKIAELFPQLQARCILAKTAFDSKFGPAVKNMEQIFTDNFPDWPNARQQIIDSIIAQRDFQQVSYEEAEQYVIDVETRTQGQVPSPILETTLMLHPDYIRNPAREFLDGFKKEYRTDGMGKSSGIKIGIEYPASWHAEEGRRPHIVQKIISQNGDGFEYVMITIKDTSESLKGRLFNWFMSEKNITLMQDEELWQSFAPGGKTINSGTAHIAGIQSIWGEFTSETERVGVHMQIHGLAFVLIYEGKVVAITFATATSPLISGENAKKRFERHGPLFQNMVNSIDFFNRYESE